MNSRITNPVGTVREIAACVSEAFPLAEVARAHLVDSRDVWQVEAVFERWLCMTSLALAGDKAAFVAAKAEMGRICAGFPPHTVGAALYSAGQVCVLLEHPRVLGPQRIVIPMHDYEVEFVAEVADDDGEDTVTGRYRFHCESREEDGCDSDDHLLRMVALYVSRCNPGRSVESCRIRRMTYEGLSESALSLAELCEMYKAQAGTAWDALARVTGGDPPYNRECVDKNMAMLHANVASKATLRRRDSGPSRKR